MFTMLSAIAEFERDLIYERTSEGRERAKAQGKLWGELGNQRRTLRRL
jgi:DNA invertase Pin-like site-specific DNA recombinase